MRFVLSLILGILLFAGTLFVAGAAGVKLPVPQLGRDYVLRFVLGPLGVVQSGADQDAGRADPPITLPGISGPDDASLPLVVIDAGHGGRDPGAIGGGIKEKDIVLKLAKMLRDALLEQGNLRVALTREDDRIVPLVQRSEIARRLDADLFISLHADSGGEASQVSGASIYTLSARASSEAAARFAARENSADEVNGIVIAGNNEEVNAILVELSQDRVQEASDEFARLIVRESKGRIAFHPQPLRSAALAVLRAPDVPSILFESGFLTNETDRARLVSASGQESYAKVLARAIEVYFARRRDAALNASAS